jgi:hypothetical protein
MTNAKKHRNYQRNTLAIDQRGLFGYVLLLLLLTYKLPKLNTEGMHNHYSRFILHAESLSLDTPRVCGGVAVVICQNLHQC